MPRPKTVLVDDSATAWLAVKEFQDLYGLSSDQMGLLLRVSAGSYRGWKSRRQMPLEMWQYFQFVLVALARAQIAHTAAMSASAAACSDGC